MANRTSARKGPVLPKTAEGADGVAAARECVLRAVSGVRVTDPDEARAFVRRRQQDEIDQQDEVWEGVYVVAPLANNPHQDVTTALAGLFFYAVNLEGQGRVLAGANVSDRRDGWEHNYRCPDVVVVLNGGRAVDCGTHWMGGPDFLVEVQSTGDATEEKLPFYGALGVRELLVVHRDTRRLRLYRLDGRQLVEVPPATEQGAEWLASQVIPFAFRDLEVEGAPRTEVRRTDGTPGHWVV